MVGTRFTVVPALSRTEAMAVTRVEAERVLTLLERLTPDQWLAPTECQPWTVRDTATHLLGNHEALASVREQLHQLRAARRRGGNLVDALSAEQIADRAGLTGPEIVDRLQDAFAGSVRARQRWPGVLRAIRSEVPLRDHAERWSMAYLHDVIYTRDVWMHRMDICRAVDAEPVLTAAHDGAMVARIVQEWADRHGQPYELALAGAAGGTFTGGLPARPPEASAQQGAAGASYRMDAVDFCRKVSGRAEPTGLLAVEVGF